MLRHRRDAARKRTATTERSPPKEESRLIAFPQPASFFPARKFSFSECVASLKLIFWLQEQIAQKSRFLGIFGANFFVEHSSTF
jgi:hypothetical protein